MACDEALANIVNYSNADSLEFACRKEGEELIVVFSDNGIPFDPTAEDPLEKEFDFLDSGGMGLSMIRQIVSSFSVQPYVPSDVISRTMLGGQQAQAYHFGRRRTT